MKYSDFEKQMAEKLREEVADLDTKAFYKQLSKPAKRRKGAIIYWLPLLLVGCFVTAAFLYMGDENTQADSYTFVPDNKIMDSTEESPSLFLANVNEPNSAKTQSTFTEDLTLQHDQNTFSSSIKNTQNNNQTSHFKNVESTTIKTISDAAASTTTNQSINDNPNQLRNSKTANKTSASSQQLKTKDNVVEPSNHPKEEDLVAQVQVASTDELGTVITTENETKSTENLELSETITDLSVTAIPSLMLLPEEGSDFYKLNTKIECPDFRINKKRFDIEALAEIGYFRPMKSFKSTTVDEVDMLRVDNESTREGYHAAAYLKFIGRQVPIYLQVGIAQDFLTERMDLEYSYIESDTTQGIISITTSETGDTITAIIGDIITDTEVTGKQRKHYRLQTIDLPLMAGYEFNFNRFSLGVEGGVIFNLRMRSTGKILSAATDFEKVDDTQSFKTNVGMSYLGGLSLGYYLTPRSKLYLNTKMRFLPSEFNSSSNSLSQKYKFLGINVGYGYIF